MCICTVKHNCYTVYMYRQTQLLYLMVFVLALIYMFRPFLGHHQAILEICYLSTLLIYHSTFTFIPSTNRLRRQSNNVVTAILRSIPKEAFSDSFQNLYERCQQCVGLALNAQLNPICHLLALLGAHHIFHVSK
jgi:hypothetical protein